MYKNKRCIKTKVLLLLETWTWFFLKWLLESVYFACNAPSVTWSSLISLLCSWACKAFINSAKLILDRSLVFSKVVIDASYLSGTVTRIFSTILQSVKSVPINLTLLTIPSNFSEYSLMVSDSFILCSSNSLMRLRLCIPRILSSPAYSSFR